MASQFDDYEVRRMPRKSNPDPNGNSSAHFPLEEEMIKVADTQAQFQAASNLYAKAMTLMKTAIGH